MLSFDDVLEVLPAHTIFRRTEEQVFVHFTCEGPYSRTAELELRYQDDMFGCTLRHDTTTLDSVFLADPLEIKQMICEAFRLEREWYKQYMNDQAGQIGLQLGYPGLRFAVF